MKKVLFESYWTLLKKVLFEAYWTLSTPIGVAAIFYATFIFNEINFKALWPVVSFVVFGSVIIHGLTRYYVSMWYSKN